MPYTGGSKQGTKTIRSGSKTLTLVLFLSAVLCAVTEQSFGQAKNKSAGQPAAPDTAEAQEFTLAPANARVFLGGYLVFKVTSKDKTLPKELTWQYGPTTQGVTLTSHSDGQATLTVASDASIPEPKVIWVTASSDSSDKRSATAHVEITLKRGAEVAIPLIGFEQAGASSAQSNQKFFFNFFVSRAVPLHNTGFDCGNNLQSDKCVFGPRLRWWGEVRVASYPQQISSGVAEFATGFATRVAQLQVNKVAQGAEFSTGVEIRLASFPKFFPNPGSRGSERTFLSWVVGGGAISPLNPTEMLQIFETPPAGSPQRDPFLAAFPSSAAFTFTGFTTPDRDKFFALYGAGVRLTQMYFDTAGNQSNSPAMLTYMLGQNQLVSGGLSRGVVQRIEAFFPLPLGERFSEGVTTAYLFGRADLRIGAPRQGTPFILKPADASVNGFDPQVNIVAVGSNRDLYTIGVAVDAVKLVKSITQQNKQESKTPASKPKTTT